MNIKTTITYNNDILLLAIFNDHIFKFLVCLHGECQIKINFCGNTTETDEYPSLRIESFAMVKFNLIIYLPSVACN